MSSAIFTSIFDSSQPYTQTFLHITSNGGQIGNIGWTNSNYSAGSFEWSNIWKTVQVITEEQLRNFKTPWFKKIEDLKNFIVALSTAHHSYGTACYAMSIAAEATFNYISYVEGVTGFMASCADMDFIRRTRLIDGAFAIVTHEQYLYPQYAYKEQETREMLEQSAAKKALENIQGDLKYVHPNVLQHWLNLVQKWNPENNQD